ncbi:MAG: hypothetical protein AAB855_04325 [Patescibacteria group bacterium]
MLDMYLKMIQTTRTVISTESLNCPKDVVRVGKEIEKKVKKLFKGSLSIREVDAGSSNAEEQECNALTNAYYDIERFGIGFVASPRHADMLFVTGPVSRNMAEALRRTYNATPDPKIVVAVGDDAIDGGVFKGSYAVYDGVDKIIPVHFSIPGDPPSPSRMMCALLQILETIENETTS